MNVYSLSFLCISISQNELCTIIVSIFSQSTLCSHFDSISNSFSCCRASVVYVSSMCGACGQTPSTRRRCHRPDVAFTQPTRQLADRNVPHHADGNSTVFHADADAECIVDDDDTVGRLAIRINPHSPAAVLHANHHTADMDTRRHYCRIRLRDRDRIAMGTVRPMRLHMIAMLLPSLPTLSPIMCLMSSFFLGSHFLFC